MSLYGTSVSVPTKAEAMQFPHSMMIASSSVAIPHMTGMNAMRAFSDPYRLIPRRF